MDLAPFVSPLIRDVDIGCRSYVDLSPYVLPLIRMYKLDVGHMWTYHPLFHP